jgi:hypothetical protein
LRGEEDDYFTKGRNSIWNNYLVLLKKVISITPNRNFNIPKVIFVSFGVLFLFDISFNLKSVDDGARTNKIQGL